MCVVCAPMGVLDWMHLSCVVCLCSDARERESLPAGPERHRKAALVWGGSANRFSPRAAGGRRAPFGFVPGGGSLRAWCLGCPARGHGLNCHLSDGSWVRDLSPAKASKHLPGFQNYSSRLPPSKPPICARKPRRRSPPTNACRNGISGAWRRALICTARHIHGREA